MEKATEAPHDEATPNKGASMALWTAVAALTTAADEIHSGGDERGGQKIAAVAEKIRNIARVFDPPPGGGPTKSERDARELANYRSLWPEVRKAIKTLEDRVEGLREQVRQLEGRDGAEPAEEPCPAKLWHGPGHQSSADCEETGPHEVHTAHYWQGGGRATLAEWRGVHGCTGPNDEPPDDEDQEKDLPEVDSLWNHRSLGHEVRVFAVGEEALTFRDTETGVGDSLTVEQFLRTYRAASGPDDEDQESRPTRRPGGRRRRLSER